MSDFKSHLFERYTEEDLQALSKSIDTIGLQHPIIIRPMKENGKYEIDKVIDTFIKNEINGVCIIKTKDEFGEAMFEIHKIT